MLNKRKRNLLITTIVFLSIALDQISKIWVRNNFESYVDPNDPTNNCLDVAIITATEKRTKKTIEKLKTVAGRVLNK